MSKGLPHTLLSGPSLVSLLEGGGKAISAHVCPSGQSGRIRLARNGVHSTTANLPQKPANHTQLIPAFHQQKAFYSVSLELGGLRGPSID